MANSIFRQKNLDRINSPESLNDYVKVTNPSVWLILIGMVIFLSGAFVFAAFCRVDTSVSVAVSSKAGVVTAYIDEADAGAVAQGMKLRVNGNEYSVTNIAKRPVKSGEVDEYLLHKADMEASKWLFPITIDGKPDEGDYQGIIIVEQSSPLSYVFN